MQRVPNKVCFITGAGSGIGQAAAELLAAEGGIAVAADIDLDAAHSVVESIVQKGHRASALQLDVSEEAAWQSAIERVLADYGQLNVLVNNAGLSLVEPTATCSLEDWRKLMSVNLDGVFLGTRSALCAMQNGGSIVNIASVSGITPAAGAAAYCSSKAAIRIFSKSVAIECADAGSGIRVNLVTPGGVKTPMWEKEEFFASMVQEHGGVEEAFQAMEGEAASARFLSPQEVAQSILYLASDDSSHLTGTEIVLDRGHSG